MLDVPFGAARRRTVQADRQRAVLHHDADSLSRARARRGATRVVLLVQREVADRIVARAGVEDVRRAVGERAGRGARARIAFRVAPGSFNPPPKVESAVVVIEPRPDPVVELVGGGRVSALRAGRVRHAPQADAARRAHRSRRSTRRMRRRARSPRASIDPERCGPRRCRPPISRSASPGALQSRFVSAKLNPSSSIAMFTVLIVTSAGA